MGEIIQLREHDYRRIRRWQCVAKTDCEATTENWHADSWMIAGSAQSDYRDVAFIKWKKGLVSSRPAVEALSTEEMKALTKEEMKNCAVLDDRRALEDARLIERTDLSVALICPEHAPAMRAHLEKLRKPQAFGECAQQSAAAMREQIDSSPKMNASE